MSPSAFSPSQDAVIAFLADPASHGPSVETVERIDTHISVVFLAGERAYKLRRAVSLPYVDFTSLEARREDCARELKLNELGAPGLYEGMEPVTLNRAGHLSIGGTGDPVDWLVVMRRFDQAERFDRLLERGVLERHIMCDVAERVWAVHRHSPKAAGPGWLGSFKNIVENNQQSFAAFSPTLFSTPRISFYFNAVFQNISQISLRLEERGYEGFVGRCHGDLHLSNIVQFEDKPALFDAMAFNDLFAVIDRLYDLSFLLMDLDFRGERRLASIVLNHYMEYSGDTEGMALLPLYLSTRASVRALVAATAAGEQSDDSLRRELEAEAKRYMEAAEDYLLPAPPGVIAVGGLSGSGKSRLAREVAPYLDVPGALVLRTDVLRKRLVGQDPYDGLGPEGYTADMSRKTYELLYAEAKRALDIGRTVVLDGVFANPLERQAAEDLARQEGVPFTGLWVEAPVDVAQDRIATRIRNPSDVTREVRQKQEGFDLGEITWVRIDSSGPKEDTVSAGLEALAGMRTV